MEDAVLILKKNSIRQMNSELIGNSKDGTFGLDHEKMPGHSAIERERGKEKEQSCYAGRHLVMTTGMPCCHHRLAFDLVVTTYLVSEQKGCLQVCCLELNSAPGFQLLTVRTRS